ncbi:MAG: hypothetical protein AAFO03_27725, partial [Bacteroidota bacterium]
LSQLTYKLNAAPDWFREWHFCWGKAWGDRYIGRSEVGYMFDSDALQCVFTANSNASLLLIAIYPY